LKKGEKSNIKMVAEGNQDYKDYGAEKLRQKEETTRQALARRKYPTSPSGKKGQNEGRQGTVRA